MVITGSGLGPAELIAATAAANGIYSTQLSGTTIRFNAIPAPLIYTSATQVAVQVPDMFLVSQAQVTVTFEGRTSAPLPIQVAGVVAWSLHARCLRERTSSRAESGRLTQYRL